MDFLLNKTSLSHLRTHSQKSPNSSKVSRREFHVKLGEREKALLAEHPALRRFKSTKHAALAAKGFGQLCTIIVLAGCCVEVYNRP